MGYNEKNLICVHQSNGYIAELDLGIISPSGEYAAYCIGWRSMTSDNCGFIEPVGTHKEHRRQGLASAVIKECFCRMAKLGIEEVIISSEAEPNISNFLYKSLNPYRKRRILEYTLNVTNKRNRK
jgi:ribosomal protein S18 acetylase RimI-like enzyme